MRRNETKLQEISGHTWGLFFLALTFVTWLTEPSILSFLKAAQTSDVLVSIPFGFHSLCNCTEKQQGGGTGQKTCSESCVVVETEMKGLKGYEKIVPAAPSTYEGKRRTTRVRIFALCFSISVAVVICLVVGSIYLRNKEGRDGARNALKPSYVIQTACNNALYRRVCISTLSSHAEALRANLSELSRVAVELSIDEAENVSHYIADLGRMAADKREIGALEDCIQQLQDTVGQLNSSLSELAHLNSNSLKRQISDVQTWLSAALTNPSTCLDGLEDVRVDSNVKSEIRAKSENMTQLISNALAVVQSLSAVGDITNDDKISVRNRRLLFEAGDFPSLGFYSPCHAG